MTVLMESAMTAQDIAAVVNVDETTIHGSAQKKEDLPGFDGSSKSRIQRPGLQSWIQAPSFSPKGSGMTPYPGVDRPAIEGNLMMQSGMLTLEMRVPLVGYALRRWSVDCSTKRTLDPKEHRLWLKNSQTLYGLESAALAPGYTNTVDSK